METKSREFKSGKAEVFAKGTMHALNPVPRAPVPFAARTKSIENLDIGTSN